MVSDVQKLFVSASFPPELRLQVMKAGVPHNTTSKLSLRLAMKTIEGLRNEAHRLLLFPLREYWYQLDVWADEETSNIIRSTAEQAFLETVIFKLGIDETLPILEDGDWTSGLSSIPAVIGSRIHYLHLNTLIEGYGNPNDQQLYLDVAWCRKAPSYMEKLKLHFPILKGCVLTIDLYFGTMYELPPQPFDLRVLQLTTDRAWTDADFGCSGPSLVADASNLFDAFVSNAPGKTQFVRLRWFTSASYDTDPGKSVYFGPLIKVECEKMAAEPENGSFGTQLFERAYRLGRSSERSSASATDSRW